VGSRMKSIWNQTEIDQKTTPGSRLGNSLASIPVIILNRCRVCAKSRPQEREKSRNLWPSGQRIWQKSDPNRSAAVLGQALGQAPADSPRVELAGGTHRPQRRPASDPTLHC